MAQHSRRTALVDVAAVCLIGAAIMHMKAVLVPLCFAALLAAILWPPVRLLVERRVPWWLAISLVTTGAVLLLVLGLNVLLEAANGFLAALPGYASKLDATYNQAVTWAEDHGVSVREIAQTSVPGPGTILSSLGGMLSSVATVASNLLMVVLLSLFLLSEAEGLADKTRRAFGDSETTEQILGTGTALQQYLMLKTLISLLTGLFVTVLLWGLGQEHAVLWGFVAFLLNYIPNVGSIIAALPAVALALITDGPLTSGLVAGIYLGVNMLVGNWMEPRMMGESLGLSPLVVLLCLLLWGWMWGPAGMLLCVPLTVFIKEMAALHPSTRWIAEYLGPNHDPGEPIGKPLLPV